jgi:hypothetical protein
MSNLPVSSSAHSLCSHVLPVFQIFLYLLVFHVCLQDLSESPLVSFVDLSVSRITNLPVSPRSRISVYSRSSCTVSRFPCIFRKFLCINHVKSSCIFFPSFSIFPCFPCISDLPVLPPDFLLSLLVVHVCPGSF